MKRKILFCLGHRANYSSIKSVMKAVDQSAILESSVILFSSAVTKKFGDLSSQLVGDGFKVSRKLYTLLEGYLPTTMAKSAGLSLVSLVDAFEEVKPDFVIVVGDRFETLPVAVAASYMNIPLVHTMGGELSGTIDESIRHAITKFAHVHFVATEKARNLVCRLGENPNMVFNYGCPRIDLVKRELESWDGAFCSPIQGVGAAFNPHEPFILVSQHAVTTEYQLAGRQIRATLDGIKNLGVKVLCLWPNPDAGSEALAAEIRKFRELGEADQFTFVKNLPVSSYIKLMKLTSCLVGNSSSGIREGAFIGTPCVDIGSRQSSREKGLNVTNVDFDTNAIRVAVRKKLDEGRSQPDFLYGDGSAAERIVAELETIEVGVQKRFHIPRNSSI